MFGFKKKTENSLGVIEKFTMTAEERIDNIHGEFDTACEKILESAKKILEDNSKILESITDAEELDMLKRLGFGNMVGIKIEKSEQKIKVAESDSSIVLYYKKHYPNYKFITDFHVKEICKKYDLIWGEVKNYVGDIPKKNRLEILNFKLRVEDRLVKNTYYGGMGRSNPTYEKYDDTNYNHNPSIENIQQTYTHFHMGSNSYNRTPVFFSICADKELFKVYNNQEIVDNQIVNKKLDPVVLAKVSEGYLVVSKWGKEENIEEFKQ